MSTPKTYVAVTGHDGKLWYVDQTQLSQPSEPVAESTAFAGISIANAMDPTHGYSTEYWEHTGFMAIDTEEPRASVDWSEHTNDGENFILAT
ncbi:hypothetical protein H0H92_001085, partial [Tricholoma furcatifolium]